MNNNDKLIELKYSLASLGNTKSIDEILKISREVIKERGKIPLDSFRLIMIRKHKVNLGTSTANRIYEVLGF